MRSQFKLAQLCALFLLALPFPATSQTVPVRPSAAQLLDFGAQCDGVHDDTGAFRDAIKALSDRPHRLTLPEGVCRITGPIVIPTPMVQIVGAGAGSVIQADFSAWSNKSNYVALQLLNTDAWVTIGRAFRDFSIRGVHNERLVSIGVQMQSLNNHQEGGHYLAGLLLENVHVSGFDTGFEIRDTIRSSFRFLQVDNCRVGFALLGENVNDQFQNLYAGNFSTEHTAKREPTFGSVIDTAEYPDRHKHGPEGITLTDSVIVGADTNLLTRQGLFIVVARNVLDLARGSSVVIEDPNTFRLEDNYVSSQGTAQAVISARPPSIDIDSLAIVGNQIDGLGKKGAVGIQFVSGTKRRGVIIERNHLIGLNAPMLFDSLPESLVVRDNYGSGNAGAFIRIAGDGKMSKAVLIDGNHTSDHYPIFDTKRTGLPTETNSSASQ